jgi:hypothetical protein
MQVHENRLFFALAAAARKGGTYGQITNCA